MVAVFCRFCYRIWIRCSFSASLLLKLLHNNESWIIVTQTSTLTHLPPSPKLFFVISATMCKREYNVIISTIKPKEETLGLFLILNTSHLCNLTHSFKLGCEPLITSRLSTVNNWFFVVWNYHNYACDPKKIFGVVIHEVIIPVPEVSV